MRVAPRMIATVFLENEYGGRTRARAFLVATRPSANAVLEDLVAQIDHEVELLGVPPAGFEAVWLYNWLPVIIHEVLTGKFRVVSRGVACFVPIGWEAPSPLLSSDWKNG